MTKKVHVRSHKRAYPGKKKLSGRDVMNAMRVLERRYPTGEVSETVLISKLLKRKSRKTSRDEIGDMVLFLKRDGLLYSPGKGLLKGVW